MVGTLITFAAGMFIGSSLGVFLMALAVAAKRADEDDWFCADAERREEHHGSD